MGRFSRSARTHANEHRSDDSPTRPVASPDPSDQHRWREHLWFARSVRLLILIVPLAVSFGIALWLGVVIAVPESLTGRIVRWIAIAAASTAVLLPLQRVMRRLIPLSALFSLTLVFPDEAPSRFGLALRSSSVRDLDRTLHDAEEPPTDEMHRETAERLLVLVAALSRHDRLTRGHSERVRAYTIMIAEEMGLDAAEIDQLRWAGLLHDIGKMHVPAEILNKPGTLTDEEYAVVKTHPERGAALTATLAPWLGDSVQAVVQHHKQWAGGGYPYGIAGSEITRAGRIVAVADAFDVMTSARSYKKAVSARAARAELERCAGTQFDPEVVRAMLGISIGRLWKSMGPVSLIAQFSLFPRQASQGGTVMVTAAAVTAAMAVTALASGMTEPVPEPERASEAPVVIDETTVPPSAPVTVAAIDVSPLPSDDPPATDPPTETTAESTTTSSSSTTTTTTIAFAPVVVFQPPAPVVTTRPATTTTAAVTTTSSMPASTTTALATTTTTEVASLPPETSTAPATTTAEATTTAVPDTTTTTTTTVPLTTTTTTTTTVPPFTRLVLSSSAPGDVASQPLLTLDADRPTQNAALANYDTNRNADPGLTIEQSTAWLVATDPTQIQTWTFPGGETELPADVSATFYVAPATAPAAGDQFHVRAGIFRCNAPRTSCTRLRSLTMVITNPSSGFSAVTFDLSDSSATTIPGGFSLELRFAVPDTSDLDAWVGYDAAPYPASITLGP